MSFGYSCIYYSHGIVSKFILFEGLEFPFEVKRNNQCLFVKKGYYVLAI